MICGECFFFGHLGRCRNGRIRQTERGFFQEACGEGRPKGEDPAGTDKAMENEQPKTKVCKNCGEEKPLEAFSRNRYGYTCLCRTCAATRRGNARPGGRYRIGERPLEVGLAAYSDTALIDELKTRGYHGTLTKQITIELQ